MIRGNQSKTEKSLTCLLVLILTFFFNVFYSPIFFIINYYILEYLLNYFLLLLFYEFLNKNGKIYLNLILIEGHI